ncbi:MAG: TonB-dependent receptor [Rhizobiales bacterium]|nr:TonB-dependent receptor [Rhizobacter sp.]
MLKRTMLARSLLIAFSGTAALSGSVVFAQTTPAQPQELQRVEITGSNIRRTDAETASPVQIITKQEIDQSGKGTVAEYLQTLTADGQGSVPFTYGRGFSGATAAGISLRGLGANATLVLINGRRVSSAVLADDAQRNFVDLNQIPLEAVERIEVVKDGASSIYGSDAVAGVVNIILLKNYSGTTIKLTYGIAEEGDGKEPRVAITTGFGDLSKDGYNVLLNAEFGKKDPIYYRDRAGRNTVGVSAIGQPQYGFDPNSNASSNIGRLGGQGTIPVTTDPSGRLNNSASPSFIGNVRNPVTNDYYSRSDPAGVGFTQTFPGAGAYCLANTNLPQNNAAGGCINDQRQQVNQVQPEHETGSFFGRFAKQLNNDIEGFVEVGYYQSKSRVDGLAISPSGAFFQPNGLVVSQTAPTQLGAAHPDNPYFGTAARLMYNPQFDTGISGTDSKSHTGRFIAGLKGTFAAWDFDTAVFYSESRQEDTAINVMNWRVKNALLNPTAANVADATAFSPAYAALPAGTYWRIGENAGLNSAAMYNALLANKSREGESKQYGVDFKVSREFGKLEGGAIGVAFGAEFRRESLDLPQWEGQGDFTGLSLTSYGGARNIAAAYSEVLMPVLKQLELTAALRYDHYSDAGSSWTPKVGAKYKPFNNFAVRGTYARGFRAPSIPETSVLAGFGGISVTDQARCDALTAAGVPAATVTANCIGVVPTFVIAGSKDLEPEKSKSATLGIVWDITPKTSLTADVWEIKRSGLIVNQDGQDAIDAGQLTRDPAGAVAVGDPGPILVARLPYINANQSLTRGFDVEAKQRFDFGGGYGKLTALVNWSHLLKQNVTFPDGTKLEYAGTHGNCDITNCIGSPKDKVTFAATWDMGQWRLGANVSYRSSFDNTLSDGEPCAQTLLNGDDYPSGCKIKSFTTLDISGAVTLAKGLELFGSIANVTDAKPPSDFETYGAIGYNPLDYSGAIGRYFRVGLKYKF